MNALIKNFGAFPYSVVFSVLTLTPGVCFAHNEYVHEQITQSAFNSSSALAIFIAVNSVPPNLEASTPSYSGSHAPTEWLQKGSYYEDEQTYGWIDEVPCVGPVQRCCDHFYTVQPQRNPGLVDGLTDFSEPPFLARLLLSGHTTNSFAWGTQSEINGVGNVGYNLYKWSDARTNELAALTNATLGVRNTSMAMMFYSLGHVLHLNQDLTSPDHVRDNAHPWGAYFESYGKAHYNDKSKNQKWFTPPSHDQPGWAYWQAQGFTSLLNFWDRNKYNQVSGADGLNNDGKLGEKLGLAEFCNGNFLGERSLYMECYNPSNKHYFPYPRESSTDFPGNKKTTIVTPNGRNLPTTITRNVVTKTRDGVAGFNHSILTYLGTKFPNARTSHSTTINDDDVLQDYHDILLPKAVEYSTGLLDYFFRGTMDAGVIGYNVDTMQYTNMILNTSGEDFKDGSFSIYRDDTNGVRSLVMQTNWSGAFTNGQMMTNVFVMTNIFASAMSPTDKLLLVYQGTVGCTNDDALDPVDKNIGIVALRYTPWGMVAWWPGEGNANDIVGNNNGTLVNGADFDPGEVSQAFSFDGEDQYVKVPQTHALTSLNRQITIEFWMNADPDNSMTNIQGLVTSDFYGIEISSGHTGGNLGVNFFISTDGGEGFSHTSDPNGGGAVVSSNQWHHIAGTYDGVKLQLYIDGQPWGDPQSCSGLISPMVTSSFVSIGTEDGRTYSDLSDRNFYGLIDEISIYNRALSAAEIYDIYIAGSAGKLSYQWR